MAILDRIFFFLNRTELEERRFLGSEYRLGRLSVGSGLVTITVSYTWLVLFPFSLRAVELAAFIFPTASIDLDEFQFSVDHLLNIYGVFIMC